MGIAEVASGRRSTRSANSASHPDSTVAKKRLSVECIALWKPTVRRTSRSKREGVFMKRSWTAMAVALAAVFAVIGCNDYGNTFQVPTGGTISSLSPANVTAGKAAVTPPLGGAGRGGQRRLPGVRAKHATPVTTHTRRDLTPVNAPAPAS